MPVENCPQATQGTATARNMTIQHAGNTVRFICHGVRLGTRATLQQQSLHRATLVIPCIAQRPSRSIDIRVRIGAAIEQHTRNLQLIAHRRRPQWTTPAQRWLLQLFEQHTFIHIRAQVQQHFHHFDLIVIHRQREQTAVAQVLTQSGRIPRKHRTHLIHIAQCNRRGDRNLRSVIQQQLRYSGKTPSVAVAWPRGLCGSIKPSSAAHILLVDVGSPLQQPRQ